MPSFTADVDPGDPVNDQLAAQAVHELYQHVDSARTTLTQDPGGPVCLGVTGRRGGKAATR